MYPNSGEIGAHVTIFAADWEREGEIDDWSCHELLVLGTAPFGVQVVLLLASAAAVGHCIAMGAQRFTGCLTHVARVLPPRRVVHVQLRIESGAFDREGDGLVINKTVHWCGFDALIGGVYTFDCMANNPLQSPMLALPEMMAATLGYAACGGHL